MIQPSELRIGNYVIVFNWQIVKLKNGSEIEQYIQFDPIQLTEEWLKKFGWNDFYGTGTEEENNRPFTGYFDEDGVFRYQIWSDTDEVYRNIKSVHELQNLHFALTGNELIIQNKVFENDSKRS